MATTMDYEQENGRYDGMCDLLYMLLLSTLQGLLTDQIL